MLKVLFLIILTYSLSFANPVKVKSDCVYLDDIDKTFQHKPVKCGLNYNDTFYIYLSKIAQLTNQDIKILRNRYPEKFLIQREGKLLEKERILEKLNATLKEQYPEFRFKVKKINYNKKIYVGDNERFKIILKEVPFGSTNIYIDNGVKTYRIYSYIETFKMGYVALEKIRKNSELKENSKKMLINITNIKDNLVENLDNMLAKSTIPRGRPILKRNVYKKPDIYKGEKVKIIFKSNEISVVTVGEAMENSYIGKKFHIKNPTSGKILTAIYKGEKKALVVF